MMAGGFMWPRLTPMVKKLLIANVAVFVAQRLCRALGFLVPVPGLHLALGWPEYAGGFVLEWAILRGQVWRFISYQYLHGGLGHIFWNMLWVYFLGTLLEQRWGGKKFFILYSLFGVVGAIVYAITVAAGVFPSKLMIGASGSVLGLVGACAVGAPQVTILLFFILPIRIRTLAIIIGAIYLLNILGSQEGADACHLGGLAVGALWVWLEAKGLIRWPGRVGGAVGPSGRKWVQVKIRKGAWERKMKRQRAQQTEIDRILKKVHEEGLGSLSRQEKKTLQQASKNEA